MFDDGWDIFDFIKKLKIDELYDALFPTWKSVKKFCIWLFFIGLVMAIFVPLFL